MRYRQAKRLLSQGATLADALDVVFGGRLPSALLQLNDKAAAMHAEAPTTGQRRSIRRLHRRAVLFALHRIDQGQPAIDTARTMGASKPRASRPIEASTAPNPRRPALQNLDAFKYRQGTPVKRHGAKPARSVPNGTTLNIDAWK